jgi:hypothetical protein
MAKARAKGRPIAPLELSANQVERWFAELTRKRLRRGVHTSVSHLQADIRAFADRTTKTPSPSNGPSPPIKYWLR